MNKPRPVKVLHVLHSLGMGGAETWLMELLRHWSKTGTVEIHFLATGGVPGVFDQEVKQLGGKVHYLRYGRDNLPNFVRAFRNLLAEESYDAIHDHGDLTSGWHFLWGVGLLPPVRVAHIHNAVMHLNVNYGVSTSRVLTAKLGRLLVRRLATHICGTSAQSLCDYGFTVRAKGPKVSVVHCGFDLDKFNSARQPDRDSVLREFGFPADARVVLFAGRLDRHSELGHPQNSKNSWLALLSARAAVDSDPRIRLLMAGAGDEQRSELQRNIETWSMSAHLRLIGVRADMGRLMRSADVLLFPSVDEGLGMVAVEAQAAGTAVLASDTIPAEAIVIPELFTREKLSSSPEQWSRTLLRLTNAARPSIEECRKAFCASAFTIGHSAKSLEAIYRQSETKRRGSSTDQSLGQSMEFPEGEHPAGHHPRNGRTILAKWIGN